MELTKDKKIHNVVVLCVKYFDTYSGCYWCGGKVQPHSEILGSVPGTKQYRSWRDVRRPLQGLMLNVRKICKH